MAITFGQNNSTLRAQHDLNKSSSELSSVYERLSSGVRINRPSDDAAGLAIAARLSSDAAVYRQSFQNINDSISAISIFEAALGELDSILNRQQEIATQASNGTMTSEQREVLDREVQALTEEYNHIVSSTSFNTVLSFSGASGTSLVTQAGYSTISSNVSALDYLAQDVSESIGDGTFDAATAISSGGSSTYSTADTLADLNSDGFLDIITPDSDGGAIAVHLGNGNGTFKIYSSYQTDADANAITAGDYNGDGSVDLAVLNGLSENISILLGNGNGTFKAAISVAQQHGGVAMRSADLNGDGNLDLVTADATGPGGTGAITVNLGNGNGTFKIGVTYDGAATVNDGMILADFNSDGNLDAITVHSSDNYIGVRLGNGNGSFKARTSFANSGGPTNLTHADVNGDGSDDIITADWNSDTLSVYLGNGNGTFKVRASYIAGDTPYYVNAADLDGDDYSDLISIDRVTNAVSIHLNNGNGTFKAATTYTVTGTANNSILAADFNGDDISDLFVFGDTGGTIDILLGNGTTTIVSSSYNVLTQSAAESAITAISEYQDLITQEVGKIGAVQSRLSSALSFARAAEENYRAAVGSITDIDVAQETARAVRLEILQKNQAAIMSHSNLDASKVLELLDVNVIKNEATQA